jgi:biopolymer transport protein ExbB
MIKAFDTASGGGLGRSQELARGIAEALLTTGAGLVVAIPALVAYHYFRARSEDFVRCSETDAASFIDRVLASRQTAARTSDGSGGPPARPAKTPVPGGAAGTSGSARAAPTGAGRAKPKKEE